MSWDGPILTDSGGFQVFSLRETIVAADDAGVTFRSVYDGEAASFTPELAADIQKRLGSDIAMCLDICLPAGATAHELEEASDRTTRWAERQLAAPRADGQLLFGISQGGTDVDLRRRSIEEIAALGFDGNALGGLSVGELASSCSDRCLGARPAHESAILVMGGTPAGTGGSRGAGFDMFAGVLTNALGARSGAAWEGA